MAQLLSTWIYGFIGSAETTTERTFNASGKFIPTFKETFTAGMDGAGWKIYPDATTGKYTLEIDKLRIRQSLTAQELIVEQTRAICGSLGITQACGKVKAVTWHTYTDDKGSERRYVRMEMEGDATHGYGGFQKGDFIRCQKIGSSDPDFTGIKGYWVQLSDVQENGKYIMAWASEFYDVELKEEDPTEDLTERGEYVYDRGQDEFDGPEEGDNIVQFGSATDKARQGAIYMHTVNGYPAIDVLQGISERSFRGCLKARLGYGVNGTQGLGLFTSAGRILSQDTNGQTVYDLKPDGSVNLGKGAIKYDPTTGVTSLTNTTVKIANKSGETAVEISPNADTAYFKGKVIATEGEFTGKVTATSGKFTGEIQAEKGIFNGVTAGLRMNQVTEITTANFAEFLKLETTADTSSTPNRYFLNLGGGTTNVIVVRTIPTDATLVTYLSVKYLGVRLPPYDKSDTETARGMAFLGQEFYIFNYSTTPLKLYTQYGFFYTDQTGSNEKASRIAAGTAAQYRCKLLTDGGICWERQEASTAKGVTASTVSGSLSNPVIKPGHDYWTTDI